MSVYNYISAAGAHVLSSVCVGKVQAGIVHFIFSVLFVSLTYLDLLH